MSTESNLTDEVFCVIVCITFITQVIRKIGHNVNGQTQGSDLPLCTSFNVKLNEEEN